MTDEAINSQGEPHRPHDDTAARPPDDTAARPAHAAEDQASDSVPESVPESESASKSESAFQPGQVVARPAADPEGTLRLQPRLVPRTDGLYYVSEILGYHDEAFVEAAFASVLRRQPSAEEFRDTLADLRSGAREKIEILRDLARSAEGRSKLAFERIAGLKRSPLAEFVRGVPVVGHLWQIVAALVRLPRALRHQRQFEAYALAQQQRIADHLNSQRLGDLAASQLQTSIADASAAVSLLSDAMAEMRARHADEQSRLAREVERAAVQLGEATRRLEQAERRLAAHDARLDEHGGWFGEYSRGLEEHGRQLTQISRRLDAQQEFLVREQQSIVEAQKAALADAEADLRETVAAQRRELDALAARVEELRAAVGSARESVGGKV